MSQDSTKDPRVDISDFDEVLNFFDENEEPKSLYLDSERLPKEFLQECEELIEANQGRTEHLSEKGSGGMISALSNSSRDENLNETPGLASGQSIPSSDNVSPSINGKPKPVSPTLSKAFQKMKLAQSPKWKQDVCDLRAEPPLPKPSTSSGHRNDVEAREK